MSRPERHNTNIPRASEVQKRYQAELQKLMKNKIEVEEKLKNQDDEYSIELLTSQLKSIEAREMSLRKLLTENNQ